VGLWAAYLAGLLELLSLSLTFEHGGPRSDRNIDEPGIVDRPIDSQNKKKVDRPVAVDSQIIPVLH